MCDARYQGHGRVPPLECKHAPRARDEHTRPAGVRHVHRHSSGVQRRRRGPSQALKRTAGANPLNPLEHLERTRAALHTRRPRLASRPHQTRPGLAALHAEHQRAARPAHTSKRHRAWTSPHSLEPRGASWHERVAAVRAAWCLSQRVAIRAQRQRALHQALAHAATGLHTRRTPKQAAAGFPPEACNQASSR